MTKARHIFIWAVVYTAVAALCVARVVIGILL